MTAKRDFSLLYPYMTANEALNAAKDTCKVERFSSEGEIVMRDMETWLEPLRSKFQGALREVQNDT